MSSLEFQCDRCSREAPYERGCAWCGAEMSLCLEHRDITHICALCHKNLNEIGREPAKRRAGRRRRAQERRELARAVAAATRDPFPEEQSLLWPRAEICQLASDSFREVG